MKEFKEINSVCVYCGSNQGNNPNYLKSAEILGKDMADREMDLVYGGGTIGLMGIVAKTVLKHGGKVTGIIPEFLEKREIMLRDVTELIVTKDMHERKRLMFDKADAFIALPGGIGTLEELVEMMTWAQLGQHKKPILLANIDGFWDPLLELIEHMITENFLRDDLKFLFLIENNPEKLIDRLSDHELHLYRDKFTGEQDPAPLDLM